MARLARIVVAGLAHHVTQRGNRREAVFSEDGDHEIYRDLLAVCPILDRVANFRNDLLQPGAGEDFSDLRRAESTGRPVGAADFVSGLEKVSGRKIERRAAGRKASRELVEANQLRLL